MQILSSYITLQQMRFHAHHGVSEQEQKVGNTFVADLKIKTSIDRALLSDALEDTLSYADVYTVVKAEMEIPSHLLEHLCGRITSRLFQTFPQMEAIQIKLTKQNPPIGADISGAAVEMECIR
jgi:dihydroneopterin aldolase